ncbi:MAG: hypothetical protein R3195_00485 [Gemmatimonadota bacterium]|nr:hypothetical protein [Gemmatimonadota bacterium]
MKKLLRGTIAAGLFLALPMAVDAQEQEACTAEISPVAAGSVVEAWGMFPAPFGEVSSIDAPEESGLVLASTEDVEAVEMSAEESAEREALANDENTTIFWLDTRNVTAGTYTITLHGEGGSCVAELTVEEPA